MSKNWTLGDIEKLSARGFRVNVKSVLHVSDLNDFKTKKIIPLQKLLDKAQKEFNKFIRNRDAQKGCISCQSYNVQQASHFFSVGQFSALRFHEDNVAGSCLKCNYFLSGNLLAYRESLLVRIGEQRLNDLELSVKINRVKKWSRFELELIYKMYKEKNNISIKSYES